MYASIIVRKADSGAIVRVIDHVSLDEGVVDRLLSELAAQYNQSYIIDCSQIQAARDAQRAA